MAVSILLSDGKPITLTQVKTATFSLSAFNLKRKSIAGPTGGKLPEGHKQKCDISLGSLGLFGISSSISYFLVLFGNCLQGLHGYFVVFVSCDYRQVVVDCSAYTHTAMLLLKQLINRGGKGYVMLPSYIKCFV